MLAKRDSTGLHKVAYTSHKTNTVYEAKENPYPTWLKYANERDFLEKWLRTNIAKVFNTKQPTIVDIGAALGETTARLIKVLGEKKLDYRITVVEPVISQVQYCQQRFFNNSRIEAVQSTLEDYEGPKADLVVAVHCLYYVKNLERAVGKLCRLADKSLIVHDGTYGINMVRQVFPQLVKRGPYIISTYTDVERTLEKLGIKYDTTCLQTSIDIRPAHDPSNPEGRNLIRFFLEQQEISENSYREVSAFLKEKGDFLRHDIGVILV